MTFVNRKPTQEQSFDTTQVHRIVAAGELANHEGNSMPDYGEILQFLSRNPPQMDAERQLHASLLELLAQCLRADGTASGTCDGVTNESTGSVSLDQMIEKSHLNRVYFR